MKQEIANLWIDALESDKYKQCTNQLRKGNSFCCLGVLTDLYLKKGNPGAWTPFDIFMEDNDFGNTCRNFLPEDVIKWSGMKSNAGLVGSLSLKLAELNDNGKSFKEIAKVIRENVDIL